MKNSQEMNEELEMIYSKVTIEFKAFIESDPQMDREDTCKGMMYLLEQLKSILHSVNRMNIEDRAKHYNVTYNAVTYISDIAAVIRTSNYAFETIHPLLEALISLESNLILQDVKYMDKRTQIYLHICHIYEEEDSYHQSIALLESAIIKYKEIKQIHELDPPMPLHISIILDNNLKVLKTMLIKYSIQAGVSNVNDWRKKVDEDFGDDQQAKLMCLVECLRTETRKHSNIFVKNAKPYKEALLQNGYQLVKPHLEIISKGLAQQKQKIQREVNFKNTMNATQQQINEEIKKKREVQEKYIKQADLRKASESFPLEYHAQLIHYAFQVKNQKILLELVEYAQIRIECRRIEVPYVNDISIIASNSEFPNIPNGYTKIPIDLNDANLKKELSNLRKSGKKPPQNEASKTTIASIPAGKEGEKKDSKKGGKDSVPAIQGVVKEEQKKSGASQWQLSEIKHKFVFMLVKKSMSAENALFGLNIVLGNEQTGPIGYADSRRIIIPYIQENMKYITSEINQYTGVKETTGLVPYIVLYHSQHSLQNDSEKKTIITDVKPLVGKNPMIPAKWGFKKIPVDLRQVPAQFIRSSSHEYVYVTFKTDQLFHISERHIQILKAFTELEATYNQRKGSSIEEEKLLEMEISFDLKKLDAFFQALQDGLKGELGQYYYLEKNDFVTHLCFEVWTKYMKNPLVQFDYMREQRLNTEIIDYDFQQYEAVIAQSNPIFFRGLKVLNLIMINNIRSDILLLSRINLELVKMLENQRDYKAASENSKLCLDRLRIFRDSYATKGVETQHDRLLPFNITCSNQKIASTLKLMKEKYKEQRKILEKNIRIRERERNQEKRLTAQELEEEENEFKKYLKVDEFDEKIQKIEQKHSQLYSIVSAIELDMMNLYFRVSLKRSEEIKLKNSLKNDMTSGLKNSQLDGLATTLKQKLGLMTGPTQTKNQQNLKELQSTLVRAGELPPPKPQIQKSEVRLIEETQKNPYSFALLMMNLAALNSQNSDKTYFLQESFKLIQKAMSTEDKMFEKAIEHSIFILSGLWDDKTQAQNESQKIFPFKDLYTKLWQKESEVVDAPILVGRNSSNIFLKLPPFFPLRSANEKKQKTVKLMSVYGKPSANGVDVSLNCTELEGTGIRKQIGKIIKVSNLRSNNLYCFAAAGVDQLEETLPIGRTGEDIATLNPLSISMLAAYLAKVSYQINEFEIAEKAARIIINQFCIQSKYQTHDQTPNNLYYYSLNQDSLNHVSLLQIKSIAETFYILALCEKKKIDTKRQEASFPPVYFKEKQNLITNLVLLSGILTPTMSSPLMSLPFLIPDRDIILRGFLLSLIPQKWMNPRMRKVGSSVMQKIMKWGLEKNEISLARRMVYKWNERKFLIMGKTLQVEEKKEVKKGGKDSKDQEVKLVEKYSRFMVQKSPHIMDAFEDSIITINEDYYDYLSTFVERAKEQISTLATFVDNPPEEIEAINNHLSLKLDLLDYLKDPFQSIKKIPNTSPYYFQYNAKILKKALQTAPDNQFKNLIIKAEDLDIPEVTEELKFSKQIYELILSAVKLDIAWSPCSKKDLINLQEKTGKDVSKAIQIFNDYEVKFQQLNSRLLKSISFAKKYKDFDYLNSWMAELYNLKVQCLIISQHNDFEVKKKIKVRYDKIKRLNLVDLLKKQKELGVFEDKPYLLSEEQLKKLNNILSYLALGMHSAVMIQNWIKLQSLLKLLCNFLSYSQLTPFYHSGSHTWSYLAMISLCTIEMLSSIRKKGFFEFKNRYDQKLMNTESANINQKLQLGQFQHEPLIEKYQPEYFLPELDSSTTKTYWFTTESSLDMEAVSSIIAYTVNALKIENKNNLVINIVRDFCNCTQHFYSLELLEFMEDSQVKLIEEVQFTINQETQILNQAQEEYQKEKNNKNKKRAALISGEKMKFQIDFQEKSVKLNESLRLLNEQRRFIQSQKEASKRIKEDIKRDTSKQIIIQREQKNFMLEFGEDYEHMYRQYGQDEKLIRNRKSVISDMIVRYNSIYQSLKNNKTSKNVLAEIQNRNEVGNLHFAAANLNESFEFWNDALATIFQTVNPIANYHEIIETYKPYLVQKIGEKEVLIAIMLLYKIAYFCCSKRLDLQRSAAHFACHLAFSLFETSGDHPHTYLMFKQHRIKAISSQDVFADEENINLTELISSLEYFSLWNIYDQNSLAALPIITLLDFISTDVVKNNQFAIKSKILKALALAQSSLLSESINYLTKVANQKDLPILWLQSSDFLKKQKGRNWVSQGIIFNNSESWNTNQNKEAILELKKLSLRPQFTNLYGILNPILFNYAKATILSKIYESEICKDEGLNDQRLQNLNEAETIMRDCLKKISIQEEFNVYLEDVEKATLLYKQNEVNDEIKKQMEAAKAKMLEFLRKSAIDQPTIKIYQKEHTTSLKRVFRLELLCKIRFSIYKINEARNLSASCFIILKNCLSNLNRYCSGARNCQLGYDSEIKISNIQPVNPAKKDDKKGGKKDQEPIANNVAPPIDFKKEEEIRKIVEGRSSRTNPNCYWHLKILFQLGKIMFKQSNFRESIKVFESVIQQSNIFEEKYFKIIAEAFLCRCKLRLGHFDPNNFYQVLVNMQKKHFFDMNYVQMAMDFGQLVKGKEGLDVMLKGREAASKIWQKYGMQLTLNGIGVAKPTKIYSGKDELTAEQEEAIRKKKKGDKKVGGKDEKKAPPKKDDPKKKKDQVNKVQYKITPLMKLNEINLLEEEKQVFENYVLTTHPNFHKNNVYQNYAILYIKCHMRCLEEFIKIQPQVDYNHEIQLLQKLLQVLQTYPYCLDVYKINIYFALGRINKNTFLTKLKALVQNTPNTYMNLVKKPFEDLIQNSSLIHLPAYSQFLNQNRAYLLQAKIWFKKCIQIVENSVLFYEKGLKLEEILWEFAQNQGYLSEYVGRAEPKYFRERVDVSIDEVKLESMNSLLESVGYLDMAIKVQSIKAELSRNYLEIGGKPLDVNAKVDEDILSEINQIDREAKKLYVHFLSEAYKGKTQITGSDLIGYLLKTYREVELMTFINCQGQNQLYKCHRILIKSLSTYKQKCLLSSTEVPIRKSLKDKFIENQYIIIKSIGLDTSEKFLYILGPQNEDEEPLSGKLTINVYELSKMTEDLLNLQSKMVISDKRSEAVRNRDYILHKKQFSRIMNFLVKRFNPNLQCTSEMKLELSGQNLKVLLCMFEGNGLNMRHKEMNTFFRTLHAGKYNGV